MIDLFCSKCGRLNKDEHICPPVFNCSIVDTSIVNFFPPQNIFADVPWEAAEEYVQNLLKKNDITLEKIEVSVVGNSISEVYTIEIFITKLACAILPKEEENV